MYTAQLEVRFHELDPYGHVNHAMYLTYFEIARIEALTSVGCGLDRLQTDGYHLIVIEVQLRYVKPATLGQVLSVETEITRLGTASARWGQRILRDDELIASLELRGAFTDHNGRPHRIPQEYLETLGPLLAET